MCGRCGAAAGGEHGCANYQCDASICDRCMTRYCNSSGAALCAPCLHGGAELIRNVAQERGGPTIRELDEWDARHHKTPVIQDKWRPNRIM